ncbi:MAG TPA: hypothetical protein VHO24_03300 [Opitutaceae bacterium]|nr:hypothetical protein [Opitutaceae bacterium]
MRLWLTAEAVSAADGARVGIWPDQSGRNNEAVQTNMSQKPLYVAGQLNDRPVLRFSHVETRFLKLPDVMPRLQPRPSSS